MIESRGMILNARAMLVKAQNDFDTALAGVTAVIHADWPAGEYRATAVDGATDAARKIAVKIAELRINMAMCGISETDKETDVTPSTTAREAFVRSGAYTREQVRQFANAVLSDGHHYGANYVDEAIEDARALLADGQSNPIHDAIAGNLVAFPTYKGNVWQAEPRGNESEA